jgi:hypothetical protein
MPPEGYFQDSELASEAEGSRLWRPDAVSPAKLL